MIAIRLPETLSISLSFFIDHINHTVVSDVQLVQLVREHVIDALIVRLCILRTFTGLELEFLVLLMDVFEVPADLAEINYELGDFVSFSGVVDYAFGAEEDLVSFAKEFDFLVGVADAG